MDRYFLRWFPPVPEFGTVLLIGVVLLGVLAGCDDEDTTSPAESSQSSPRALENPPSDQSDRTPPKDISIPDGMVFVPSGTTRIGISKSEWNRLREEHPEGPRPLFGRDATPPFKTHVEAFLLKKHPVTVAEFRTFIDETGYTTQAEEFGDGGVLRNGQWELIPDATWHHPRGPSNSPAPDDHPVTQVSWNDADAYCEWADARLPTEIEWEHAARQGQDERSFCIWSGSCTDRSNRTAQANTWQGRYPLENTAEDGYRYTSPVGEFGETQLGLQDMSGNVWEWTASWMTPYDQRTKSMNSPRNGERVQRGGSFICDDCGGYYIFSRSSSTPRTSLFHVGFRCAADLPEATR